MDDLSYTFAVARVRANEAKLLTENELNALIGLKNVSEIIKKLNEKGYALSENGDTGEALYKKTEAAWAFLREILPDQKVFDSRLIGNDFANLKLLVKAFVCEKSPEGLLLSPSVYSPEELQRAVFQNDNQKLPEVLRHAHRSAYRILTKTRFAQLSDAVIDRNGLEAALTAAKNSGVSVLIRLADTEAAVADIKILYRCIKTEKEKSFMERAVCRCETLDIADAVAAAVKGRKEFDDYVKTTPLSRLAKAMAQGEVAFERACDEEKRKLLTACKWEPFGLSPLVWYYEAVLTEVKNVRILLAAKKNGLPDSVIGERMRMLYV